MKYVPALRDDEIRKLNDVPPSSFVAIMAERVLRVPTVSVLPVV
jgi:hypothetical protein